MDGFLHGVRVDHLWLHAVLPVLGVVQPRVRSLLFRRAAHVSSTEGNEIYIGIYLGMFACLLLTRYAFVYGIYNKSVMNS